MHTIPEMFKVGRLTYRMLIRDGEWMVYEQLAGHWKRPRYEVVSVRWKPQSTLSDGTVIDAGEYYPTSRTWGTDAWTFYELKDAMQFFEEKVKDAQAQASSKAAGVAGSETDDGGAEQGVQCVEGSGESDDLRQRRDRQVLLKRIFGVA